MKLYGVIPPEGPQEEENAADGRDWGEGIISLRKTDYDHALSLEVSGWRYARW